MPNSGHNETGNNPTGYRVTKNNPMRRGPDGQFPKSRRLLIGLAPLLLIVLVGAYWIYWRQVATRLQTGIEAWVTEQRNAGTTLDFQWQGVKGFPFSFTADFNSVNILGKLGGLALSARTDHLQLNMSPVDFSTIRLLCDKPLTVIIPGLGLGQNGTTTSNTGTGNIGAGNTGTGDSGIRLVIDQADGAVRLRNGALAGATVDANKTALDRGSEVLSAASLHLDMQLPADPPRDFKDPAATINLTASTVDMPSDVPQLLPGPITQTGLNGIIRGPLLPSPGGTSPTDLADVLAHWRDAGGVVDVSTFDYAQGPVALSGSGTFALDANLQPIGAGKVTASGLADLVELLSARGVMKHKDAAIAQAIIGGLQKPGSDGRPEVTIGLNIQDRVVSFGIARLFKLPTIIWP